MNYKISKELFEAVCGFKVEWIRIEEQGDYVFIVDDVNCSYFLDSFFFKCKEWAYKQECELLSGYRVYDIQYKGNNSENKIYCDCKYIENGIQVIRFKADSEQQAVFDTCQWILEQ